MVVVLSACNGGKSKSESNNNPETDTVVKSKEVSLDELTVEILTILKNKEYKKLADYIHPELGLRFTPYAFIVVEEDICLKPAEFLSEIEKQNLLNWGSYVGTGDPIKLSINEYFTEFVYTADFLNAEKKSINEFLGGGNTTNNLEEVYKDCDFMEFHFSGFNPEFEGFDWCSLRLVFKEYRGKYYLVGIVHDQWTV
jgi:hypothetical protein